MNAASRSNPSPLALELAERDRHRSITLLAVAGLLLAAMMAVVGLPPVDLHGPLHMMGIMDPFCGGTRAVFFTIRGDLATAWNYNPLGILVVGGALAALIRAAVGLTTRRWVTLVGQPTSGIRRAALVALGVGFIILEIRQQLRVDLLTAGTFTF